MRLTEAEELDLILTAPCSADEVIAELKLAPHPEGGYYREIFRDAPGHMERPHSTAILYLLKAGDVSRWHRVNGRDVALVCRRAAAA